MDRRYIILIILLVASLFSATIVFWRSLIKFLLRRHGQTTSGRVLSVNRLYSSRSATSIAAYTYQYASKIYVKKQLVKTGDIKITTKWVQVTYLPSHPRISKLKFDDEADGPYISLLITCLILTSFYYLVSFI